MKEYDITEHKVYFIDDPYDNQFPHWRTNHPDGEWEQLMGMSWECSDPPMGLVVALKKHMGL